MHTARVHHASGDLPRLEVTAKPRGAYGWQARQEVAEDLVEGHEYERHLYDELAPDKASGSA